MLNAKLHYLADKKQVCHQGDNQNVLLNGQN